VNEEHAGDNRPIQENVMNCREAAEQEDKMSQTKLGEMYLYGKGVSHDHDEAVKWFRNAGDKGYAAAQLKIDEMQTK